MNEEGLLTCLFSCAPALFYYYNPEITQLQLNNLEILLYRFECMNFENGNGTNNTMKEIRLQDLKILKMIISACTGSSLEVPVECS